MNCRNPYTACARLGPGEGLNIVHKQTARSTQPGGPTELAAAGGNDDDSREQMFVGVGLMRALAADSQRDIGASTGATDEC